MTTLLEAALAYARNGYRVLPLHDVAGGHCSCLDGETCRTPGKHPRLGKWQHVASTDTELIAGWWSVWPTANIGILTGRPSNLCVLDVDPRNGGDQELERFLFENGPLPEGPVVQTGGGGRHYYFACPPGEGPVPSFDLAPGLELKADGRFVVAPPSRT